MDISTAKHSRKMQKSRRGAGKSKKAQGRQPLGLDKRELNFRA
jgi:hypothetical protein